VAVIRRDIVAYVGKTFGEEAKAFLVGLASGETEVGYVIDVKSPGFAEYQRRFTHTEEGLVKGKAATDAATPNAASPPRRRATHKRRDGGDKRGISGSSKHLAARRACGTSQPSWITTLSADASILRHRIPQVDRVDASVGFCRKQVVNMVVLIANRLNHVAVVGLPYLRFRAAEPVEIGLDDLAVAAGRSGLIAVGGIFASAGDRRVLPHRGRVVREGSSIFAHRLASGAGLGPRRIAFRISLLRHEEATRSARRRLNRVGQPHGDVVDVLDDGGVTCR
jgi:hypothetical protein